jgi:hypothetical protein
MATVLQFPLPRTPRLIFAEVQTTKATLAAYYARLDTLTLVEERDWHEQEERLTELQAEADGALIAMTGQPWLAWEGALA